MPCRNVDGVNLHKKPVCVQVLGGVFFRYKLLGNDVSFFISVSIPSLLYFLFGLLPFRFSVYFLF